jgi:methionyl aminopeptidase
MSLVKNDSEIEVIKQAGRILAATLEKLKKSAKPGITTIELDAIARSEILKQDAYPAFNGIKVGPRAYPANICASINEVVVHGIPSRRKLQDGDIISIDAGVKFRDYYADAAFTVGIGRISDTAEKLIKVTKEAIYIGIENVIPGRRLGDVSAAIQSHVESNGFSVVRVLVGHGIGTELWEEPQVPNYGKPGTGPVLRHGMVLALEPMVNAGTYDVETLEDGWTVVTKDRKLSAHFEHTIAVLDSGAEILTA